jgi:hypothetical protein
MAHEDRLEAEILRLGVDYQFEVKFGSVKVRLRPLSMNEMLECHAAVKEHVDKLPASYRTEITQNTYLAREFLKKASSPFGVFQPQITDIHLDKMTNGQVMSVYKEWLAITEKTNPDIERLDDATMKALVEDIKKNPRGDDLDSQLTELSFWQLRSLVAFLLTKGD